MQRIKHQPIGTAIIILNTNNQILLGKRKNTFKAGHYGLPGGRIKKGEKLINAVNRELLEETNLKAKNTRSLVVIKEWQENEDQDFVHFLFVCTDWTNTLQLMEPDKCEGWEWFNVDALPQNILPGHLAGINYLKNKESTGVLDF